MKLCGSVNWKMTEYLWNVIEWYGYVIQSLSSNFSEHLFEMTERQSFIQGLGLIKLHYDVYTRNVKPMNPHLKSYSRKLKRRWSFFFSFYNRLCNFNFQKYLKIMNLRWLPARVTVHIGSFIGPLIDEHMITYLHLCE